MRYFQRAGARIDEFIEGALEESLDLGESLRSSFRNWLDLVRLPYDEDRRLLFFDWLNSEIAWECGAAPWEEREREIVLFSEIRATVAAQSQAWDVFEREMEKVAQMVREISF